VKNDGSASTLRERVEGGSRRLAEMASKRRRAYRLGILLGRSADFELPSSIKFGGERKGAVFPVGDAVKVRVGARDQGPALVGVASGSVRPSTQARSTQPRTSHGRNATAY